MIFNLAEEFNSSAVHTNPGPSRKPGYPWLKEWLSVSLGDSKCTITSFTNTTNNEDFTIDCKLPKSGDNVALVAGIWKPKLHFEGLGYA